MRVLMTLSSEEDKEGWKRRGEQRRVSEEERKGREEQVEEEGRMLGWGARTGRG
jgi:hypothetical protein